MSKHTPAPWELDDYEQSIGTYRLEGFGAHALKSQDFDAYVAEDEANRRLIEAAPLLLEALEAAASLLNRIALHESSDDAEAGAKAAEAAIAKAKGGE